MIRFVVAFVVGVVVVVVVDVFGFIDGVYTYDICQAQHMSYYVPPGS